MSPHASVARCVESPPRDQLCGWKLAFQDKTEIDWDAQRLTK